MLNANFSPVFRTHIIADELIAANRSVFFARASSADQ